MKKLLLALTISLAFANSYSSEKDLYTDWKIKEIENPDGLNVGYIYHTESIGFQGHKSKTSSAITSMRIICSTIDLNSSSTIISVYWDKSKGIVEKSPMGIYVDNNYILDEDWQQLDSLVYRNFSLTDDYLVPFLESKKPITFNWIGPNDEERRTTFDLWNFDKEYKKFVSLCHHP